MTVRQKKGIRAAVLVFLLLLVAIGTYDSRHGYLAALAESRGNTSAGNGDPGKVESSFLAERVIDTRALPGTVKAEGVVDPGKAVEEEEEWKVAGPMEEEKDINVAEYVPTPVVGAKPVPPPPEPPPREPRGSTGDDARIANNPDPGPEPEPDPDRRDRPGSGVIGDRNKGHGNDDDGYDEDNPGRGRSDGVESSRGWGGRGSSGGSGGRGKSSGRGGSGRGGSKGRR